MAYFARIVKGFCRSTKTTPSFRVMSSCCTTRRINQPIRKHHFYTSQLPSVHPPSLWVLLSLRHIHSQKDNKLAKYLDEKIRLEETVVGREPNLEEYHLERDGTHVTLSRTLGEERILISFDVNNNENVPLEIDNDDIAETGLLSYPEITISIQKQSGITLLFNCLCDGKEVDDAENYDDEENGNDLISIMNVQVYDTKQSDLTKVYEADCDSDIMDEELYSMLLHTLMERGIHGKLINNLIRLSACDDKRQHLNFLKSLQEFVNEK